MKKVNVLIVLIVCGLFNVDVFGLGARRGTATTTDAEERNVSEAKPVVNKTLQRTSRQGRQSVATSTAQRRTGSGATRSAQVRGGRVTKVSTTQAPTNVNALVWEDLSDEQKSQFNALNRDFLRIVSLPAEDYRLWRDKVVGKAETIIAIDNSLEAYCLKVIGAELEKKVKAEEIDVDVAIELQSIASELQTYIPDSLLTTGTEKEQFNGLMGRIPFAGMNRPTDEWLKAVAIRARNLVTNKELTIEDVQKALKAGFSKVARQFSGEAERLRVVNTIVNNTKQYAKKIENESTPEYVNDRFQNLLLTLVDNWDMANKQPKREWINDIIEVSRKMMTTFNMPLNDIEQQIGAQVYFVAVTKAGRFLNPQEEKNVIALVTDIKNRISTK